MPPQGRYEYRIPRSELGADCRRQSLVKAWKAREVRLVQGHETHRRAGGSEVQRPDIQIPDLLRRKQGKAPPPPHYTTDVIPLVEVGRRRNRIAEPDARLDGAIEDAQDVLL